MDEKLSSCCGARKVRRSMLLVCERCGRQLTDRYWVPNEENQSRLRHGSEYDDESFIKDRFGRQDRDLDF